MAGGKKVYYEVLSGTKQGEHVTGVSMSSPSRIAKGSQGIEVTLYATFDGGYELDRFRVATVNDPEQAHDNPTGTRVWLENESLFVFAVAKPMESLKKEVQDGIGKLKPRWCDPTVFSASANGAAVSGSVCNVSITGYNVSIVGLSILVAGVDIIRRAFFGMAAGAYDAKGALDSHIYMNKLKAAAAASKAGMSDEQKKALGTNIYAITVKNKAICVKI